jgi:lipopolysaccharide/colanic/teichoic acid biosynthesis glycosyltransferase
MLLIPGLPIIGLLVILTRLTSRGPGIYRQIRVGRDGRQFTLYKIRTMRHDAEERTGGAVWTMPDDERVTAFGRILRKLHLDEFPQLLNVLRGEMSLVGPRPERPEFVEVLQKAVPDYVKRLCVAPGVTGLAQVNLPPDSDLQSVHLKVALDLDYIQQASLSLDLRLLVCTFLRLFKLSGDPVIRWLRLDRKAALSGQPPAGTGETSSHGTHVSPHTVLSGGNGDGDGNGDGSAARWTPRDASHPKPDESIIVDELRKSRPR